MKLHNPRVVVPYFVQEPTGLARTHSHFSFTGDVDKRRVRRMIRGFLRRLGIHAPKHYIDHYINTFTRHG